MSAQKNHAKSETLKKNIFQKVFLESASPILPYAVYIKNTIFLTFFIIKYDEISSQFKLQEIVTRDVIYFLKNLLRYMVWVFNKKQISQNFS